MFHRILVTGGAGFIGSNFLDYMTLKYPDVEFVTLDQLKYTGVPENLQSVAQRQNCFLVQGSTTDVDVVTKAVEGVDGIVNFAAQTHVDRSLYEPGTFVKSNLLGTEILLEAARQARVEKLVQISTAEVYGTLPAEGYFTEESPLAPNNPYGATKAGADLLVKAYFQAFGLPVNITRCTNNYGPRQFPEKLIPLFITNALEDKKLPLFGDGKNIHDWLFVEDNCRAIELVLLKGIPGEIYNIGGKNELSNLEVTQIILAELNKPFSLISFVQDRPCHDFRLAVDASKVRELGFTPLYDFQTGIQKTIAWYQEHAEWWKRLKAGEFREYYSKIYGDRL